MGMLKIGSSPHFLPEITSFIKSTKLKVQIWFQAKLSTKTEYWTFNIISVDPDRLIVAHFKC